jgi:hypothetical protein
VGNWKYSGVALSNNGGGGVEDIDRKRIWRSTLQLHNIFLSFLLSENWILKCKRVYVDIVLLYLMFIVPYILVTYMINYRSN